MSSAMSPEKARELRDGHPRQIRRLFIPQHGTRKQRELRFDHRFPGQVDRARALLDGLEGMTVAAGATPGSLSITYEICDYTLEGLEAALRAQGFHFEGGILRKLHNALVHFSEETQLRNMRCPERLLKKSHDIYSRAWDRHAHGDHDDTPPDLRHES